MSAEARTRLAAMQAELVSALAGRAAPPPGFDVDRVRATAAALVTKRQCGVARTWPGLAEALGDRWVERFDAFAAMSPAPHIGGPLADGRAFLRWLAATGDAPEACRLQMLAVDLRFVTTTTGLMPRRGPALKIVQLHQPRRLVMAMRLPWRYEIWLSCRSSTTEQTVTNGKCRWRLKP
jgi:hypothetical protein